MRRTNPTPKFPARFEALAQLLQPQAIVADAQYRATVDMIDRLMAISSLTKGQALYLETMVQLVQAYEAKLFPVQMVRGVDALKHLIEENKMTAADLSRLLGVHASMGSKILKGERSLTVDHIIKLSGHFGVRPDLFIDQHAKSTRRAS